MQNDMKAQEEVPSNGRLYVLFIPFAVSGLAFPFSRLVVNAAVARPAGAAQEELSLAVSETVECILIRRAAIEAVNLIS